MVPLGSFLMEAKTLLFKKHIMYYIKNTFFVSTKYFFQKSRTAPDTVLYL